jgi:selenide,water dikinase
VDKRHLVLAGGGHAHVEVLRQLAARPLPGWRVTLVTRERHSPYSGMLPGVAAGLYRPEQALIDLPALAARAGVAMVLDRVAGIDPAARLLRVAAGAAIGFDLLSLNTGATPELGAVPGAAEHAIPLKPIDALLPRLEGLLRGEGDVALVGGGAAGFEMALAFAARGRRVTLVAGAAGLLPGKPEALRRRARAALGARGVALRQGQDVAAVRADGLVLSGGEAMPASAMLWATGAAPPGWLAGTGLPLDARGFLRVGSTLQVPGHPTILAAGDVASLDGQALPRAGVVAVRQGPVLAHNLHATAEARAPIPYRPQRDWLMLLSLGDGHALGTRNGIVVGGRWVWWWKDRIDRRFMARYGAVA